MFQTQHDYVDSFTWQPDILDRHFYKTIHKLQRRCKNYTKRALAVDLLLLKQNYYKELEEIQKTEIKIQKAQYDTTKALETDEELSDSS